MTDPLPRTPEALARAKTRGGCHNLKDVIPDLAPTPQDGANTGGPSQAARRTPPLNFIATSLRARGGLMPTPKASDGTNGGPGMRNGRGQVDALPAVVSLLPTPSAADALGGHHNRSGTRKDELLLGGIAAREAFGPYSAAVARWEHVLGRPAPSPTEPGREGKPRLNPAFVEWMMGLPAGWVTDSGIPRAAQLRGTRQRRRPPAGRPRAADALGR